MNISPNVKINCKIVFEINEEEARALEALSGYGEDAFIEAFYEKLGKHYMLSHEAALRSFLKGIRETFPNILSDMNSLRDKARPMKRFY